MFWLAGDAMASDVTEAEDIEAGCKGVVRGFEEAALLRKKEDLDVRSSVDGTSRKPLMKKADGDV